MFRCEGGHCPRANKLILRLQPNTFIGLQAENQLIRAGTMSVSYTHLQVESGHWHVCYCNLNITGTVNLQRTGLPRCSDVYKRQIYGFGLESRV